MQREAFGESTSFRTSIQTLVSTTITLCPTGSTHQGGSALLDERAVSAACRYGALLLELPVGPR